MVKVIKVFVSFLLIALLLVLLVFGGYYLKYRSIVNSPQNTLKTEFSPAEFGKYVNHFIGTGGYFYNCINNFPGANVPFSMVRLSPDTKSFFKNLFLNGTLLNRRKVRHSELMGGAVLTFE